MLAKFLETGKNLPAAGGILPQQPVGEYSKTKLSEQLDDAIGGFRIEQAGQPRINHVQRHADGHRFPVMNLKVRDLFQFMRRPMPEIQRTRRAGFKRVAATGDMA